MALCLTFLQLARSTLEVHSSNTSRELAVILENSELLSGCSDITSSLFSLTRTQSASLPSMRGSCGSR